jgi:hypothetical protein
MPGTWRLMIPALILFICACVAAPFGVGTAMRNGYFGTDFGILPISAGGQDAWIGIRMRQINAQVVQAFGLRDSNGVIIDRVYPNSPADSGGIQVGDVIRTINGTQITDMTSVESVMKGLHPGDSLQVQIDRPAQSGLQQKTVEVKAGVRPRPDEVRNWQTFQAQGIPFQVKYPDTWIVDAEGAPQQPIQFSPPSAFEDVVQIRIADRVPALDDWYKQVIDANKDGDVTIVTESKLTVAGMDARQAVMSFTDDQGDPQRVSLVLTRSDNGRGYFFLLSTDPSTFDGLSKVFNQMLQSFSFVS